MTNLTNVELTQLILIGIGVLLLVLAPVVYLIYAMPSFRTFNLKRGKQTQEVVLPRKESTKPAGTYRPTPVYLQPMPRIVGGGMSSRAADLKETAKMHFGQVLRSSQRLLKAVRQELTAEPPPAPDRNLG